MARRAAKELLHVQEWLGRVDEITRRGKHAYFQGHCCVTRSLVVLDRGRRRGHSDYELEFVECGRQPEHRRDLDSEFVVAAT